MDYTEAIKEYESKNIFFLTEFEKMVFKHAFEMGYSQGKVDGIKEGFCDAL